MVLPPIQTQVGNQSDLYLHSPASPPYHPTMMPPLTLTNLPTMTSMSLIIFFLGYYIHVSNVSAFSLTPPHSKPSYGATNTHTHKIILKIKKKKITSKISEQITIFAGLEPHFQRSQARCLNKDSRAKLSRFQSQLCQLLTW